MTDNSPDELNVLIERFREMAANVERQPVKLRSAIGPDGKADPERLQQSLEEAKERVHSNAAARRDVLQQILDRAFDADGKLREDVVLTVLWAYESEVWLSIFEDTRRMV
ncbi:MAG: hypothetical protein AAF125_16315 [Chloroflexota bacterium]